MCRGVASRRGFVGLVDTEAQVERMRQLHGERAAVIAQGELNLLRWADVALVPRSGGDDAIFAGDIGGGDVGAIVMQVIEKDEIDELCFAIEQEIATAEKDQDEIGLLLF